ncbi:MAG: GGDEF domain-containing protein [Syntrophobacteraceae bacterium]
MKKIFGSISRGFSFAAGLAFRTAKKADYEILNRRILDIMAAHDLEGILDNASRCLNGILSYRLFAFALEHGNGMDLWVDPSDQGKTVIKMVEKDFRLSERCECHHFSSRQETESNPHYLQGVRPETYDLMGEDYYARLYLVPERTPLSYHRDIVNTLLKAIDIAIANTMSIKKLRNEAAFDPLTDCYNRREFDRLVEHSIANARRYRRELSVIMLDIDHFKKVNDEHGHQAGDKVLKEVAHKLRSELRKSDYVSRYGGEEFIVVLPDTNLTNAAGLAERLRKAVEECQIPIGDGATLSVTASFGVAALKEGAAPDELIGEADAMLYGAKTSGRNRVISADRPLHLSSDDDALADDAQTEAMIVIASTGRAGAMS